MKDYTKLNELAASLPDSVKENALTLVEMMSTVLTGVGDRDIAWRPSVLKLIQGSSDRSALPKGANIGSFVLGEDILDNPLRVIPIRSYTARQYWDPNPDNKQMLCSSPDGKLGFKYGDCRQCPHGKFDEEAKKSACNKVIQVLVITEDLSKLFLINFAKTNYTNGTAWEGLMKKAFVATYKRVYELTNETSKKAKNVEVISVGVPTGNRVEAEKVAFLEELFHLVDTDRKESLVLFYDNAKNRENHAALMAPAGDVELLSGPTDDIVAGDDEDPTKAIEGEVVSSEPVTPKAKKYNL